MSHSMRVFLFGDLTVSFEDVLRELLYSKDQPILRCFLEKAAFALREEIARLPTPQQAQLPRFTTLIDLLPQLHSKPGSPALSFALLCLCEIGSFIR
jgi:naphtho-gamma-pyrone polyketide synthase